MYARGADAKVHVEHYLIEEQFDAVAAEPPGLADRALHSSHEIPVSPAHATRQRVARALYAIGKGSGVAAFTAGRALDALYGDERD